MIKAEKLVKMTSFKLFNICLHQYKCDTIPNFGRQNLWRSAILILYTVHYSAIFQVVRYLRNRDWNSGPSAAVGWLWCVKQSAFATAVQQQLLLMLKVYLPEIFWVLFFFVFNKPIKVKELSFWLVLISFLHLPRYSKFWSSRGIKFFLVLQVMILLTWTYDYT
jgi:hypothetical protein